jgi:class 3 adenylate cyclase
MTEVGLSIRVRAALLLVAIAALPAAAVAWRLTGINRHAVEVSEGNLQAAVVAEVAKEVLRRVRATEEDTKAIANAISLAAARPEAGSKGTEAMLGGMLASRRNITAFRFEVPAAKVDTVIKKPGVAEELVPRSRPEMRREANERGVSFTLLGPGVGAVVVPVPKLDEAGSDGFVTASADLAGLTETLGDAAGTRFPSGGVSLVVADGRRRVVSANGTSVAVGADVTALPVFALLPAGASWMTRTAVVNTFADGGEHQVGAVETVEDLGWAVALWRPERVAYSTLYDMQRTSAWVVGGTLFIALVVGLFAGSAITRPVMRLASQARLIGQRRWREVALDSNRRDELGTLSRAIGQMAQDLESGETEIERQAKLRGDLSRFLSKDLVDAIVRGEHSLALGGQRREVSVLFADVVAFTPLAESRPAEEVVTILNELFSILSEIVFRHEGTVDKFIGDCIMAVWGAPQAQPDHAQRALAAAEDMQRFLETANQMWSEKYGTELRLAIGVNSGEAIVGNIGSDKRMEYTVIGDVVNVAARLEAVAKPNQVLVAQRTHELAGAGFELRSLGSQQLTGRKTATDVYELLLDVGDA